MASFPRGRALDVACGAGRNALFLAASGFDVDAIDIADIGLERARAAAKKLNLDVNWIAADLDAGLELCEDLARSYDLIVLVRYVNMPLISELISRLTAGGVFVCEQHIQSHEAVAGPTSDRYRLRANELLAAAGPLNVKFYREGIVEDPDHRRVALAQLIATNGKETEIVYC